MKERGESLNLVCATLYWIIASKLSKELLTYHINAYIFMKK